MKRELKRTLRSDRLPFRQSLINATESEERLTSLFYAVSKDNFDLVRYLVDHGANVKQLDRHKNNLLSYVKNNFDILDYLLEKGLDINQKGSDGLTPLLIAVRSNNFPLFVELIKRGADINVVDKRKGTLLLRIADRGNTEMARYLLENFAINNPAAKSSNGYSALSLAVINNNIELVRLLLDLEETKKNINSISPKGLTPLLQAIENKNAEMAKLLIDAGADIYIRGKGDTPLTLAVFVSLYDVAKILLEHGANINDTDPYDFTPIMIEVFKNDENLDFVEFLLSYNPDLLHTDKQNQNVFDIAFKKNKLNTLALLEKWFFSKEVLADTSDIPSESLKDYSEKLNFYLMLWEDKCRSLDQENMRRFVRYLSEQMGIRGDSEEDICNVMREFLANKIDQIYAQMEGGRRGSRAVQVISGAGPSEINRAPVERELNREDLSRKTVKELVALCRELGLGGCSNKRKEELIQKILSQRPQEEFIERVEVAAAGPSHAEEIFGGYGIERVESVESLSLLTVKDLIERCKKMGIRGYSNKRKDELIQMILSNL